MPIKLKFAPWSEEEWISRYKNKRKFPKAKDEKYRSLLGKGSFGEVYRMQGSDRYVAVKIMNVEDLGLDEKDLEREAKLLQSLKHKNVIQYVANTF